MIEMRFGGAIVICLQGNETMGQDVESISWVAVNGANVRVRCFEWDIHGVRKF